MYLELTVLLAVGVFIVLFVSTALLEKLRIRDYVPASPAQAENDSPYFVAMNEAARRLGFSDAGVFVQDRNSRIYQARLALWISPDRQTLLRIAGGKTAGVLIKRTSLTSVLEPDRILETADEFGMADLSGVTERKTILNGGLDELLDGHQERLAQCPGVKRIFSATQGLAAYEEMQAMKARQMEKIGLGKFLNREGTIWRHTLKGAVLLFFKGFRAQLAEGKAQAHRVKLKRPGQK